MIIFKVHGAQAMAAKINTLAKQTPTVIGAALYTEAEIEMTEAKRRTPVDTGALRASGFVEHPVQQGRNVSVRLGFGGPAAAYALIVHEDLTAFHKVGEAKYLERTLLESRPHMANRIANAVRASVASGL